MHSSGERDVVTARATTPCTAADSRRSLSEPGGIIASCYKRERHAASLIAGFGTLGHIVSGALAVTCKGAWARCNIEIA